MQNKIITSKELRNLTGFNYNWINKHFRGIKQDYFAGTSNVYNIEDVITHARKLLLIKFNSKNVKQNYVGEKMLEKLIKALNDTRTSRT